MRDVPMDLINQFAKVIVGKDQETKKEDANVGLYGVVRVDSSGNRFVKLDGASEETPVYETMAMQAEDGDRVVCSIKNHQLVITGNLTAPASARTATDILKPVGDGSMVGNLSDGDPTGTYILFKDDKIILCEPNGHPIATFSTGNTQLGGQIINLLVNQIEDLKVNNVPLIDYIPQSQDTWKPNTKDQEGYVTKGSENSNSIWGTDAEGNPGWKPIPKFQDLITELTKVGYKKISNNYGVFEFQRCGPVCTLHISQLKNLTINANTIILDNIDEMFLPITGFTQVLINPGITTNLRFSFQGKPNNRIVIYLYGAVSSTYNNAQGSFTYGVYSYYHLFE